MLGQSLKGSTASRGAPAYGLPQRQRLDAGFNPHGEHLGQGALDDVTRAVVHQLGDGAAADGAHVVGLVADGVQHGLAPLVDLPVPAHPDGQVHGPGTAGAATHRRVQYMDALGRELLMDAADQAGGAGAQVKVNLAGAHPRQQAILPQGHRLNLGGTGK